MTHASRYPGFERSKHWRGVPGARHIETDPGIEAEIAVGHALAERGIILFDGPPGTGKTYAIKTILADLEIEPLFFPVGPSTTGKAFETALLTEIYKHTDPAKTVHRNEPRDVMRDKIHAELSGEPSLLVIDDFHASGIRGADVIRWLFEQDGIQATFLLSGNSLCRTLSRHPAFYSRVMRVVPFSKIPGDQIVDAMLAYHPILERSDPELIRAVDREHANGVLRLWAIFLEFYIKAAGPDGPDHLERDVVDAAYAAIPSQNPGEMPS